MKLTTRLVPLAVAATAIAAAVWLSLAGAPDSVAQVPVNLDPVVRWRFDARQVARKQIKPIVGTLPGRLLGDAAVRTTNGYERLELAEPNDGVMIQPALSGGTTWLPQRAFTIAAWVRIDARQEWGGILSCFQDNGTHERGVVLGFDRTNFFFGLATAGGQGQMTYLRGKTSYEPGKWHHVAAVYDGTAMTLYVNGQADGASKDQSGDVRYAEKAPLVIGRYQDDDESFGMVGGIREVIWTASAAPARTVADWYAADNALAKRPAEPTVLGDGFVIEPYLQAPTRTGMTIMCETAEPTTYKIEYGFAVPGDRVAEEKEFRTVHELRLDGLQPKSRYLYRVVATTKSGAEIRSRILSFGTAVDPDDAWCFTVVGDTQKNPKVTGRIAKLMWEARPHFVLHCGDVVDNGPDKKEWTDELFTPSRELFGRVAVMPTIGNHEKNHEHYYRYFSLPKPEYYYSFTYGNAEFFAIDTNKPIIPGSEQYQWLDRALGKSTATWKICYHHHPAYSSDNDDYGDSFKQFPVGDGDPNSRRLVPLYEKHNVDVVFSGHIHVYERTWPIRAGKVDQKKGVQYIISGGGGGSLEDFTPTPNWFKAEHRSVFHHLTVTVQGGTFRLKAIDENGRLFDQIELKKDAAAIAP
jgi:predicted phosphodiesterase